MWAGCPHLCCPYAPIIAGEERKKVALAGEGLSELRAPALEVGDLESAPFPLGPVSLARWYDCVAIIGHTTQETCCHLVPSKLSGKDRACEQCKDGLRLFIFILLSRHVSLGGAIMPRLDSVDLAWENLGRLPSSPGFFLP